MSIFSSPDGKLSTGKYPFDFLIFFVTGRCNARCKHCFYWKNIGSKHRGLSLAQVEQIARSSPPFRTLLLSGGEPTLREDLPQLIDLFRRYSHIHTVDVPTNGLVPDRIVSLAEEVLTVNSTLRQISFNLSIDGFSETHNRIRGVDGSFERAMETGVRLKELKASFPNLRVVANSVICADNYAELVDLSHYLCDQGTFDDHFFEIVRGSSPNDHVQDVPVEALEDIYTDVLPIQESYLRSNKWSEYRTSRSLWRRVSDVGRLIYQYRTQWRIYSHGGRWCVPCLAGDSIAVIDYDGSLRACELHDKQVNLQDFDFDFSRALASDVLATERRIAKSHHCDCTHVCFLKNSMQRHKLKYLLAVVEAYAVYKLTGRWV